MKHILKQLVPPIVHTLRWYHPQYGWKGDYASFAEANLLTTGYDAEAILQRIAHTTRRVVSGEIAYERDGIEYSEPQVNMNLLASLLHVASLHGNQLCVLDFGGSLGTTYWQLKSYLGGLAHLQWCIVEQPHYVELGQQEFQTEQLRFYYTVEECLQRHQPQVVVFCGVIQYIEDTFGLLEKVAATGIPYLLLDYVGYTPGETRDRITVQHVPPVFYGVPASYTCWFYDRDKMIAWLGERYEKVFSFLCSEDKYYLELLPFRYEGQLWRLR